MAAGEQRRDLQHLSRSHQVWRLDGISLVVWPETAVPFFLAESAQALTAIGDVLPDGTSLLVGSGRIVEERDAQDRLVATRVYNSLLAIGDKGEVLDGYDKIHLVPFGEYLPFQDFMEKSRHLPAHRRARRLQRRHRLSPALGPRRSAGAAAHLLRDHLSRRDIQQRSAAWLASQRDQRCVVRRQRRSLSAFSSSAATRRRARFAGGARRQHRHLGDHRSLRTRARRARSQGGRSRRRSFA